MPTDDAWAPVPPDAPGHTGGVTVPGYSGLHEVARGGDSVVYRGHQDHLDRDVAIKVIDLTDPSSVARFDRELEITVRLGRQHPHIVTVLDTTQTTDGRPCLVMDFHDLGSLHDRLRDHGPLTVSETVAAGAAVADALAFAHSHGILHRDVKPQNVLVLPTSYVLSDFGIARMADAGHTASLERFSYRHASPQVLDGLEPTEADDVWSLGSTIFTLVTGRAPFSSDDPAEDTALAYLRRVRTGRRRGLPPDLPDELRQVIDACLVQDREQRTWSATDVRRALGSVPTEDRSWAPSPSAAPAQRSGGGPAAAQRPAPDAISPRGEGPPPVPTPRPATDDLNGSPPAADDAGTIGEADPDVSTPVISAARPPDDPVVATSALAHLGEPGEIPRTTPDSDAAATSLRPDESGEGHRAKAADGERPRRSPARTLWIRIAAFVGGALVTGAALGALPVLLGRGSTDEPDPTSATLPEPVDIPSLDEPLPTASGPVQAPVGDPALAPRNPAILHNGTSVLLTWALPEQEVDYMVVVEVSGDDASPVRQIDSGTAELRIEGIDPDAPEVCYAIVGYTLDPVSSGASEVRCAGPS